MSLFILSFCLLITDHDLQAQEKDQDSLSTPFRKGRWMTGLNGSFSSDNIRVGPQDKLISTNEYGLDINTGFFFQERWYLGFTLGATRSSGSGFIERDLESFIVGPTISRYFLKDHFGSLYLSATPGFVQIRDEVTSTIEQQRLTESLEGPGFGIRTRLGYSYVIGDKVVLDVGLNNDFSWFDLELVNQQTQTRFDESIFSNSTSFSFGFKVLLDEFFF